MQIIEGFLFMNVDELVSYGVPVCNIRAMTMRYRQNKTRSWICRKDPQNKRKILILYKSIPQYTKKKYQIPSEGELLKKYELQKEEEIRLQRALTI